MADPQTTEPSPIVEALRAEIKALQPGIVDLHCRIRFMQGRIHQGRRKAAALRDLIAVYEREESAKQS